MAPRLLYLRGMQTTKTARHAGETLMAYYSRMLVEISTIARGGKV